MSEEKNNIDEIFKHSFENARITAPNTAFDAVQSKLGSQVAHTHMVSGSLSTIKMAAITLGVVGAVTGVYFGFGDEKKAVSEAIERSIESKIENTELDSSAKLELMQPDDLNSQRIAMVESYEAVNGSGFQKPQNSSDLDDFRLVEGSVSAPANEQNESLNQPVLNSVKQNPQMETYSNQNYAVENISPVNEFVDNPLKVQKTQRCKGLFKVDLERPIEGPQELAIGIKGKLALYEWGTGNESISKKKGKDVFWKGPIYVKKSQEMRFWVRALFMDGCRDTFEFVRWVVPTNYSGNEVFPNVFTPNGDGYNDSFYVNIPRPEWFELRVIDARGNEVFSAKDINVKWSGYAGEVKCPKGIYQVQMRRKYIGDLQMETKIFTVELR